MDSAPALTILHVDMDAFYAAVEALDHPEYRGKPLVVGAPPDRRGVVATCSYEARRFGIHSAMPSRTAGKLCPHAIFVPPRMVRYEEVSRQIMGISEEFTPLIEPLSLDEAFLDVRGALHIWGDAVAIATELKRRIKERLGLTASVGVAPNKYLAKVASDLRKPDGLVVTPVKEPDIMAFLAPLPVTKIWGIGKVSSAHLARSGIQTIGQLQACAPAELERLFGSKVAARDVWDLARGRDDRPVVTHGEEKSISNETTFDTDCADQAVVRQTLLELTEQVGARLRQAGKRARTAQIKVRTGDFKTLTRQCTLAAPCDGDRDLLEAAFRLFERENMDRPVRLIGFGVSNLTSAAGVEKPAQGLLFPELDPARPDPRGRRLDAAVDTLRKTFGRDALKRGNWKPG
jgi:nucleotidyltransferase/DNA polymerase involved in DNA repair